MLTIFTALLSNLKLLAIGAAILAVTNVGTGLTFYIKGYNAAASVCKANEAIRQRDEARRDLEVAKATGEKLTKELSERDKRLAESDRRVKEYADTVEKREAALREAEKKAAAARPKGCPTCPPSRRCVVE
jgi:septal ring factor EnvC (AmiA/AmiB activator)